MRNSPLERNRAYALLKTVWHGIFSVWEGAAALIGSMVGKPPKGPLPANRFFEAVHFLFVSGPKHFWKRPTAIGAGRSVGTFLRFVLDRERSFSPRKNKGGFTMIEVMVAIAVVSLVLVSGFQSFGQIAAYRTTISNRMDLEQDLYYNVERLAALVKEGGAIDYEEYWNRLGVGTTAFAGTPSAGSEGGKYVALSGFGNYGVGGNVAIAGTFGNGPYSCVSGNAAPMAATGGCLSAGPQRYGEYALQFTDANANADNDGGDEDGNGSITGDDDDEDLGSWPPAFSTNAPLRELYLIKKGFGDPQRLILRWSVITDPQAPAGKTCTSASDGSVSGEGCLGRLEMLKLVGKDFGLNHSGTTPSTGSFDGKIDTWQCVSDFYCAGPENTPVGAGSTFVAGNKEWVSVFPDDVNVSNLAFFPFPNKDYRLSWKETDPKIRTAPYVRINMTLGYSWFRRKRLTGNVNPQAHVTTTVSLSSE